MTLNEIETALGQRLATMAACPPIVWPNRKADPARPYLSVQHVPVGRQNIALAGGAVRITGFVVVTVVTEIDGFTTEANTIAQAVIDRFPAGLRIPAGRGHVVIRQEPEPITPFRDGDDWRQPVRIPYGAEP